MANTLIGGKALTKAKKKKQPISFTHSIDPRVGGTPAAPSAPRIGTPAGNAALNIAWAAANPGKQTPAQQQGARLGTPAGALALNAAWAAANPGKVSPNGTTAGTGTASSSSGPVAGSLGDDAQAAAARAQAIFDATQQRAALVAQGQYSQADLDEAIRRMQLQRPKDDLAAKESANNAGLFYSGKLVNTLGDIGADYVRQEGDARTAFQRSEETRQAQLKAIEQQQVLQQLAIDAALADRQAQRDADSGSSGSGSGGSGGSGSGSGGGGGSTSGPTWEQQLQFASSIANSGPPIPGTPAGNAAMVAAWLKANPGKLFPG